MIRFRRQSKVPTTYAGEHQVSDRNKGKNGGIDRRYTNLINISQQVTATRHQDNEWDTRHLTQQKERKESEPILERIAMAHAHWIVWNPRRKASTTAKLA